MTLWSSRVGLAVACLALFQASVVHADGAFPDAQSVLLPRDRPRQILVATTFGLVFSDDDGANWSYSCEDPKATQMGAQYWMGPPPSDRIFAVSVQGAPVSWDGGCTWMLGGGALLNTAVTDVFPDPTDADHVFAVAISGPISASIGGLYSSRDGGRTYQTPSFTETKPAKITGVEIASSSPRTVYVTIDSGGDPMTPKLARSDDAGQTWSTTDLQAALGSVSPRLIAIDSSDANRIYLRLISGPSAVEPFEALAITTDAGATWTQPLVVPGGTIVGFVRSASGVIVVSGTTKDGEPAIFRSTDGGVTFTASRPAFHPRGLAERNGVIYAPTQDNVDTFALVSSADGGITFRPRMKLADISAVRTCVRAACQSDCESLSSSNLFPATTCSATETTTPTPTPTPAATSTGCSCALRDTDESTRRIGAFAMSLVLVATSIARRRRSRRRTNCSA